MHFMLSLQLPTAEINCSKGGYFSLLGERVQTSPLNILARDVLQSGFISTDV